MTRELATAIVAAVAVLILAAMAWGWRRRTRRDARLHANTAVPPTPEGQVSSWTGAYVATTAHDEPLNRLAVRHLGFRGRARLDVRPDGVVLTIAGEPPVFLAARSLIGADRATWAIDRVVEKDGLIRIAWHIAPDTIVDSYLRIADHADAVLTALDAVTPTPATTGSNE